MSWYFTFFFNRCLCGVSCSVFTSAALDQSNFPTWHYNIVLNLEAEGSSESSCSHVATYSLNTVVVGNMEITLHTYFIPFSVDRDHSERAERAAARWDGVVEVCVCVCEEGLLWSAREQLGVQCLSTGTAGGGGGRGFLLPSPAEIEASGTCPESSDGAKSPQTSVDTHIFFRHSGTQHTSVMQRKG